MSSDAVDRRTDALCDSLGTAKLDLSDRWKIVAMVLFLSGIWFYDVGLYVFYLFVCFFLFLLLTVYICLFVCECFLCNFVLFVFAMGRVAWNKPVMMINCVLSLLVRQVTRRRRQRRPKDACSLFASRLSASRRFCCRSSVSANCSTWARRFCCALCLASVAAVMPTTTTITTGPKTVDHPHACPAPPNRSSIDVALSTGS